MNWTDTLKHETIITQGKVISDCLAACDGNKTKAAWQLGISRDTLHRKLTAYAKIKNREFLATLPPKKKR